MENIVTPDTFTAFVIGYIDGDGTINKGGAKIDGHKNLEPLFIEIRDKLLGIDNTFNITLTYYDDMVRLNLNMKCSRFLNNFRTDNNLPVLERKWRNLK